MSHFIRGKLQWLLPSVPKTFSPSYQLPNC